MATAIAASMLALRFLTKKAARIVHVSVEMSYISYSLCPKSPCFGSDLLLSRTSLNWRKMADMQIPCTAPCRTQPFSVGTLFLF